MRALDNHGKVQYGLIFLCLGMISFVSAMLLDNRIVMNMYEVLHDTMEASEIMGITPDYDALIQSMSLVEDEDGVDFEKMFQEASLMILPEITKERVEHLLLDNMQEKFPNSLKHLEIAECIVYPQATGEKSPNGVLINTPGVYVKVELEIQGMIFLRRRVSLAKTVLLTQK